MKLNVFDIIKMTIIIPYKFIDKSVIGQISFCQIKKHVQIMGAMTGLAHSHCTICHIEFV